MTCPRRRSRAAAARWGQDRVCPRRGQRPPADPLRAALTTAGVTVAIEVFEGNTADPKTLATQIRKLTTRFGLTGSALSAIAAMFTSARIDQELRPAQSGLDQRVAGPADQSPR